MSTIFFILVSFFYISGAYFFFMKRNHLGSETLPLRIMCFVISPGIVPLLYCELITDLIRGTTNKRSS